ncbi:MAG: M16 family metallopeptidase [Spirosomataceae bacterium]
MQKISRLFLFIGLIIPSLTNAQDLSQTLPMDPQVKIGKLSNGLTYYIRKNTEPKNRAQLRLAIKAGSILETDEQQGLAHFMEHMSFNGTKNFPKNELVSYLQKTGLKFGADLNAYTSFDETVYQLPVPTDTMAVFEKYFLVLSDWAYQATLDPTEIDKERGVVLEESRGRKGASARMLEKTLPVMLKGSQYANRLPIGKDDILQNFKPAVLEQFYKDWYRPDLQAVVAVGDFDVNVVEGLIKKYFEKIPASSNPKPRTKFDVPLLGGTDVAIVTDKEQPYPIVQIMYKQPERKEITGNDRRTQIAINLFNSMLQQRIQELQQKADPPFQFGASNYGGFLGNIDAFNVFTVAKGTDIERATKAVLDENARVQKFGFTATEFDRAKKQYMTGLEKNVKEKDKLDSESFTDELVNCFLNEVPMTDVEFDFNFAKQHLEGIKIEEVNALASKFITPENRVVLVQAPESMKDKLPTEAQIKEWLNSAGKDVTAYKDETVSAPLLSSLPAGTKVVAEKKIAEIGVTEFTFANGARAIIKPTDFKNDEIQIRGASYGGTNLYGDADADNASLASTVVGVSGIADFNAIQLRKYMTGKIARVNASVGATSENIFGSSSVKDFETALQLVYAQFTKPRKDEDAVKGFMNNQKDLLGNLIKNPTPEKVFGDSVSAILSSYHPRRMPMTVERFEKINPDRALAIYKERFADASDFIFTFVGNINPETAKPLLEKYIGGLPSIKRKETFKDLKIYPPKGKVSKTIYKGTENKASVTLYLGGALEYNKDNSQQISALGEILQLKLIDRLREEESGVYSPRCSASASKVPAQRYSLQVNFGCSPENVEKLINATLDELNKIRQNGADQKDIDKFKAEDKRDTEEQLKDNNFWASYLSSKYLIGEDAKDVLKNNEELEKITPASTKATANKYFNGDNFIRIVLLPETKK